MNSQTLSGRAALAAVRLLRLPLAMMVALTAVTAARLAGPGNGWTELLPLFWGVLLLSTAASVLNQVLERDFDALVPRTMHRPLASAEFSVYSGYRLGLVLAMCGAGLLVACGLWPVVLGLVALFWYLLIYTPLKRMTSLAVLVGTPCGALPVLIGWLAAGGSWPAPQPLALMLVLVLWQVPHFWLLALPDREELAAAGYRVLPSPCSERQLLMRCHRWLLGLALATLLLPALGMVTGLAAALAFLLGMLLACASSVLLQRPLFPVQAAFRLRIAVSFYLLLLLMLLIYGRVM